MNKQLQELNGWVSNWKQPISVESLRSKIDELLAQPDAEIERLRAELAAADRMFKTAVEEATEAYAFVQGIASAATGKDCPPVTRVNIHRVADEVLAKLAARPTPAEHEALEIVELIPAWTRKEAADG